MPSVEKTKRYLNYSQFVDEMIADRVFSKIDELGENSGVTEWHGENGEWRIKKDWDYSAGLETSYEECRISYYNGKVRKSCWIYREPFETDDKYKFSKEGYCITGIQTK
jgi:hypothetical protein